MNLKNVCKTIRCLSNLKFDMIKQFSITASEEQWLDFAEGDKYEATVKYGELFVVTYDYAHERIEWLLKNKTWGKPKAETEFKVGDAVARRSSPCVYAVITGESGGAYMLNFFGGSAGFFKRENIIPKPITVENLPNGTYFKLKNDNNDLKYLRVVDKEFDGYVSLPKLFCPTSFYTCKDNPNSIPLPA